MPLAIGYVIHLNLVVILSMSIDIGIAIKINKGIETMKKPNMYSIEKYSKRLLSQGGVNKL